MSRILSLLLMCCLLMPLNAVAAEKAVTILAAFGTSDAEAEKALLAIGDAYKKNNQPIIWTYSSNIIRAKLAKEGRPVFSMSEALDKAASMGATNVLIQSLHVIPAEEFCKIERMVIENLIAKPGRFESVILGHSLLESGQDLQEVVDATFAAIPKERTAQEAVVLMGHGNNRGPGDLTLIAADNAFQKRDPLVHLASVEGVLTFNDVLPELVKAGVKRVWLMPFMIVAGDHAKNDMAGPEADSWASQIRAAGMEPISIVKGMGHNPAIQNIFLRHSANAADDLVTGKKNK